MRTINVSTDVFAKVWSMRKDEENNEDDILRRILDCPKTHIDEPKESKPEGFYDARHKVSFKEGFEIFRYYKGKEYRAVATGGRWQLINTKEYFTSLNQLSSGVADGNENAWVSWNYNAPNGSEIKLSKLRDLTDAKDGAAGVLYIREDY